MAIQLVQETHVFDWRPDYPFATTAKRYWDPGTSNLKGYTLIFSHGTGFNKEQWEPTMNHLFRHARFPIREAWAVDCPNHGDAAILNEDLLIRGGYDLVFSWEEYTKVLYLFLTRNPSINFNEHKLIGITHSMGSTCLALTVSYPRPPKFQLLIFCEPMIMPTDIDHGMEKTIGLWSDVTVKRQDVWRSKEEAFADLSSKRSFRIYDREVLKAYVEHGMRQLPTALYPNKEGVTLKCTKAQEAACYRDSVTLRRMYEFLPALYSRVPVHIIWGEINDSVPSEVKDAITDARQGRKCASVARVRAAGHLIIQMNPMGLAEAIASVFNARESTPSRL